MYKPRPSRPYTIKEAFEAAIWCHYCGEDREAKRFLTLIINHVVKEPVSGQEGKQGPSAG